MSDTKTILEAKLYYSWEYLGHLGLQGHKVPQETVVLADQKRKWHTGLQLKSPGLVPAVEAQRDCCGHCPGMVGMCTSLAAFRGARQGFPPQMKHASSPAENPGEGDQGGDACGWLRCLSLCEMIHERPLATTTLIKRTRVFLKTARPRVG